VAEVIHHVPLVPPYAGLAEIRWLYSQESSLYGAGIFTQAIHIFYRLRIHPMEMLPLLRKYILAWHFARQMVRH